MSKTACAVKGVGVSFCYPHSQTPVLEDCSFSFEQGTITSIVGKNGEGKTTLGKLCASILKPTQGDIFLFGNNTKHLRLPQVAKDLCYCFQSPAKQLFADTVAEEIAFALRFKKLPAQQIQEKVAHMLSLFGLEEVKDAYPLRLSGGEQQRLAIAAGFALDPRFILLDEPTAGLDRERILAFSTLLKKLAKENHIGVAVISHDQSFVADISDSILHLEGGKLYAESL